MKAHPLYLEKFEYSPSLIFPKFSVRIISSLIKASLIKKVYIETAEIFKSQLSHGNSALKTKNSALKTKELSS